MISAIAKELDDGEGAFNAELIYSVFVAKKSRDWVTLVVIELEAFDVKTLRAKPFSDFYKMTADDNGWGKEAVQSSTSWRYAVVNSYIYCTRYTNHFDWAVFITTVNTLINNVTNYMDMVLGMFFLNQGVGELKRNNESKIIVLIKYLLDKNVFATFF